MASVRDHQGIATTNQESEKSMKITSADQKVDWSRRIQGDVEFAPNLGIVMVDHIWCTGSLRVGAGTSIKAGGYIEAGWSIKAGGYIEAGTSIKAGGYIEAGRHIKAGGYIEAGWSIEAGTSIKAGGYIEAGWSIKAGGYIEAGTSIKAGGYIEAGTFGITAGYWVTAKLAINTKMRVIAGVSPWIDGSNPKGSTITCGKLESGTVIGTLVETGLPDAKPCTPETIVVDGVTYRRED